MDVTCERCQTEYEFDDALVSERGTTVKCTNCGQQFKVHRSKAAESPPERWVVRQASGRELVFTTLRDLQRAIANRQVGRDDMLSRDAAPPRALAAIAELEPFFAAVAPPPPPHAAPVPRHERAKTQTWAGVPPPAQADSGLTPAPGAGRVPSPRTGHTAPPPPSSAAVEPASATLQHSAEASRALPSPPSLPARPAPLDDAPTIRRAPPSADRVPTPPPRDVVIREAAHDLDPTPNSARSSYASEPDFFADPRFQTAPAPRSRALRWVVALVVLGMTAMAAGTVGRPYIEAAIHRAPPPSTNDARVADLLHDGEKYLADGDLVGAKEAFDKASVLAERDPQVLTDLARLAAVRGDLAWLKLRLLPADQADLVAAAKQELGDAAARAKRAVDGAAEVAPDSPSVTRAKIDVLRLLDDRATARSLVPQVGSIASQPETAFVLAMLDVAEPEPIWPTVIERLRIAATGEQSLFRARGALVYALASSGDVASAKGELEKIVAAPRPFPLLGELKAFVARSGAPGAVVDAGVDARPMDAGAADAATNPVASASATKGGAERTPGSPALPSDHHELLKQASSAKSSGQLARAEQLYSAALAQNPADTEALAGLGDVAKARGDLAGARRYYEQVHAKNPDYLPVTAALADMRWDSGDRAGAAALYRALVEAAPGASFAARAKDRLAQWQAAKATTTGDAGASSTQDTKEEAPAATPTPPPAKPEAPDAPAAPTATAREKQDQAPEIDTSDLPGFGK